MNPHRHRGRPSLFGRISLGYVVVESRRLPEWQRFARDGLGLHADAVDRRALALRIDAHQRRIVVRDGPAEDVVAIGWQLHDEPALHAAGPVARAPGSTCRRRRRRGRRTRRRAPLGLRRPEAAALRAVHPAVARRRRSAMQASGFVTGELGLGHFAMTTREPEAALRFFQRLFDARLSDTIEDKLNGVTLELSFLRLNERHHGGDRRHARHSG